MSNTQTAKPASMLIIPPGYFSSTLCSRSSHRSDSMEADAEMSSVVHDIFRGGKEKTSKIIFLELEKERA